MTAAAWLEVRQAMIGALRLARGDRRGLSYFDRSADGFWRSFRAAVISYPLYLVLLSMRVTVSEWEASGALLIITVETIAYVIAWTAFPLLMLILTQRIGRPHRFFDFMVPYNWSQLPQSALFVLVGLETESGVLGAEPAQAIEVAAAVAVLVYEWFIARAALETTAGAAVLVVLVDLLLGVLISQVAGGLY
jgi:branched-subunit amino acid transport protein AzlD